MKKNIFFLVFACWITGAQSGLFSSKQGVVFQTKGEAKIIFSSTFTGGTERMNIPIPNIIDLRLSSDFNGLVHDRESGWTRCRVPLKGELGWSGIIERSLVFECKPIQHYK